MTVNLDFYFDFGSPTAYLAYKRLNQLQAQYDLNINYMPILLGGIFKAAENTSPVAVPAKGRYMLEHDLPRFARRYAVPLNFNRHFPLNTLNLMRGAIAADRLACRDAYLDAVFTAVWVDGKNMGEPEVVTAALTKSGLDAAALVELSQDPEVKAELITRTQAAVERGLFGAPTMFIGDEMFFGQDRLDFVEEILQA